MSILNNKLSAEQYATNFADIHPPFENHDAALVEANRCLFCYFCYARMRKIIRQAIVKRAIGRGYVFWKSKYTKL